MPEATRGRDGRLSPDQVKAYKAAHKKALEAKGAPLTRDEVNQLLAAAKAETLKAKKADKPAA